MYYFLSFIYRYQQQEENGFIRNKEKRNSLESYKVFITDDFNRTFQEFRIKVAPVFCLFLFVGGETLSYENEVLNSLKRNFQNEQK